MTSVWSRLTSGLAIVGGVVVACVGVGTLCGLGHADWVGFGALFIALAVIAATNRGLFLALMVLVVLDGVPGPELASNAAGSLKLEDVAIAVIVGVLLLLKPRPATSARQVAVRRATYVLSGLLITWWIITVARSDVAGIPVSKAMLFGRDFLYFALLLPLAGRVSLTARELRWLIGVLGTAMVLYAFGNIATATGIANVRWLVHGFTAVDSSGIVRVYSPMADLVAVAVCFSIAGFLTAADSRTRWLSAVLLVISLTSFALELTRAYYIGLTAGFALVSVWWLLLPGTRTLRFRLAGVTLALAAAVLSLAIVAPSITAHAANSGVASRATSAATQFFSQTGTVSYRYQVLHQMAQLLGGNWPVGMGFLHPAIRSFSQLPGGSIRNSDVGVFNSVMTMGVIGSILLYVPVLYVLGLTVRRRVAEGETQWIAYGGALWIVTVIASSVTLVVLFSPNGLVLSALVLAFLVQVSLEREPVRQPVTARTKRVHRGASPRLGYEGAA